MAGWLAPLAVGSRGKDADASGRTTLSSGQNSVPSAGDPPILPAVKRPLDGSPARREAAIRMGRMARSARG